MKGKAYTLIVLGFLSILIGIVVIVGSILMEVKLVDSVYKAYQPIGDTYNEVDMKLTNVENDISGLQTDFNAFTGQLSAVTGTISDQTRQVLINGINALEPKVTNAENILGMAKDSVNSINSKVDLINSLGVINLPKLSGDKVSQASDKIDGVQSSLNNLKSDLSSDGTRTKPVLSAVNQGLDQVQTTVKNYHSDISDAHNKVKNLKDFIILWSSVGTVFIVLFFLWTIYSFISLIRNQFTKLKSISKSDK